MNTTIPGPWCDEFAGKTWRDMPGDPQTKKFNFALFRRGLFNPEDRKLNCGRNKAARMAS